MLVGTVAAKGQDDALQKEVTQSMQRSAEAQAACALDEWRTMHTADWIITFPSGQTETAANFLKTCSKVQPTVYDNVQVRIYGGDTAIVNAQFRRNRPEGATGPLNQISQVWVKQGGKWLNANSHVTTIQKPGAK